MQESIIFTHNKKKTFLFSAITPNMKESTPSVATIKDVCLIVKAIDLPTKKLAEKKTQKFKKREIESSAD